MCGIALRLTSYIDDFLSVSRTIRQALITAIELVYEATAAGLTISVEKCRLSPATIVKVSWDVTGFKVQSVPSATVAR